MLKTLREQRHIGLDSRQSWLAIRLLDVSGSASFKTANSSQLATFYELKKSRAKLYEKW